MHGVGTYACTIPTQSEDLRDAWEDVKAMFNGGNRKRSASGTNTYHTGSKLSALKDDHEQEKDDQEEINDEKSPAKRDNEEEEGEEENDGKCIIPLPPPPKLFKSRTKERRPPTHNVVSSTTTDEQLPDMNLFLPLPPPPPPLPTSLHSATASHYFPFPPPLPSPSSLSFVPMNSNDWLQFFRSPLFVPSIFRSPFPGLPRRFPCDINHQSSSIIGSGSQSAFKPPVQKYD